MSPSIHISVRNVLAGIRGRGEPHLHGSDSAAVPGAHRGHDRVSRIAHRAHAVEDGTFEARRLRDRRIHVQRVAIAAQAVDERCVRGDRKIVVEVGLAPGEPVHGSRARIASAAAPVPAKQRRLLQRADRFARRIVDDIASREQERAERSALVVDSDDPRPSAELDPERNGTVNREHLLAVQHALPVDARRRVLEPEARIGGDVRHHREHLEPVLVDVAQVTGVFRLRAEADPERIEDAIGVAQGLCDLGDRVVHERVVGDGHCASNLGNEALYERASDRCSGTARRCGEGSTSRVKVRR